MSDIYIMRGFVRKFLLNQVIIGKLVALSMNNQANSGKLIIDKQMKEKLMAQLAEKKT